MPLYETTTRGPRSRPLEDYAACFDALFATLAQRRAFRRYLEGLLLSAERNKTLIPIKDIDVSETV